MRKLYLIILLGLMQCLRSQISSTSPEFEAQPIGGKDQLEQVLQTQLTLPKSLLTKGFESEVIAFFNLDSTGKAINMRMDGGVNNLLRNEVKRMFNFLRFRRTLNMPDEPRPYFLIFRVSTDKYEKYMKQRTKIILKKGITADSSYTIYSKADRSPDFYKNGDEGLKDYLLSELEYPRVAIEKSIQGTVVLEFVVETNGFVSGITVKQQVNGGCTEEAVRLIKQTKWQPAMLNNQWVRYKMSYPITFSLINSNRDNSGTIGQ